MPDNLTKFIKILADECTSLRGPASNITEPTTTKETIEWCREKLHFSERENKDPNIMIGSCISTITRATNCLDNRRRELLFLQDVIPEDKDLAGKVERHITAPILDYDDLVARLNTMAMKAKNNELLSQYNLDGDFMGGEWKLPKDFPRSD